MLINKSLMEVLSKIAAVKADTDDLQTQVGVAGLGLSAIPDMALDSTVAKNATVALDSTVAKEATLGTHDTDIKADITALDLVVDGVETKVDTAISDIGTVDSVVDGIQVDLSNATDGLGALKTLIDAVPTNPILDTEDGSSFSAIPGMISVDSLGMPTVNRAVTATLFVGPNGDNSDGSTWAKAYTTIQAALAAASTDVNECTLILIGINTGANYYDINTTGDPTYTGNYILKGSHRNWAKIKNDHVSATTVMKFTGYISLQDLNINLGTSNNGVIITKGGFRVDDCMFVGEDLTSAATAIHIDSATAAKNGKIRCCDIKGEATNTHMTGIILDNAECADIVGTRVGFCINGLQQVGANSAYNRFKDSEFCTCTIAVNIDAGGPMSFDNTLFYNNDLNVDDEVGNHTFTNIKGEFPIYLLPLNDVDTGVSVSVSEDAWGGDTELIAANAIDKPFKVIGYILQPSADENMRIRFSSGSAGTDFFAEDLSSSKKNKATGSGDATDFIFNANTRISASAYGGTSGKTIKVWLEIQEI